MPTPSVPSTTAPSGDSTGTASAGGDLRLPGIRSGHPTEILLEITVHRLTALGRHSGDSLTEGARAIFSSRNRHADLDHQIQPLAVRLVEVPVWQAKLSALRRAKSSRASANPVMRFVLPPPSRRRNRNLAATRLSVRCMAKPKNCGQDFGFTPRPDGLSLRRLTY